MSKKNDGGPAFPHDGQANYTGGMSLRDYFAAKAMAAFVAKGCNSYIRAAREKYPLASHEELLAASQKAIARQAYEIADAMLEARDAE